MSLVLVIGGIFIFYKQFNSLYLQTKSRGGAVVARWVHTPKVVRFESYPRNNTLCKNPLVSGCHKQADYLFLIVMKREKDDFDKNCRRGVKPEEYNDFIFSIIQTLSDDGFLVEQKRMTFREAERLVYRVMNGLLDAVDKHRHLTLPGSLSLIRYGDDENHYYSIRDKRKPRK